ncbi:MAG: hypothetical protein KF764_14985 [Labilithrix sp.]|nr:hypothetical protein [Labilithrix sp.]MBX3222505.1 hypothetical protein [Labilithrix sp.]
MRPTLPLLCGFASLGLLVFAACTTDYQKGLEDPAFGAPNALAGQKQPGPSSENTADNGSSGTSGGAATTPECVKAGGTLVDGGACDVSFKTILAAFKAANCQTAGSCHGGATPPNQPRIDPDDPDAMWAIFAGFKLSNGTVYINPCSTDPAQSTIGCNINAAAACGSVMPPGAGLPGNVIADIDTWLKCGAPNN